MTGWLLRESPCPLDFNNTNLRVIELNGQPWFVATDVCRVLGLTNPSVAVKPLDESERVKRNLGQRGLGSTLVIAESGLYKLIMRRDKPEAKAFQDWVTKVVLPAIRTMPQMPVDFHTVTGEPE